MEMIMNAIVEWLKEILVGGIVSNLSGMFDNVNQQVGDIVGQSTDRSHPRPQPA